MSHPPVGPQAGDPQPEQPGYPTPHTEFPPGPGNLPPPGAHQPDAGLTEFQPHPSCVPPDGQPGSQPPEYSPPGGYGQPIAAQPMSGGAPVDAGGWIDKPHCKPTIPPGLEYLTTIDQLLVHQKLDLLEEFTGFEMQNKYTIKNSVGEKVYYAVEDSDCLTRNCCCVCRQFDVKILDSFKNEVIHLYQPPACVERMEVSSPPGTVIGSIEEGHNLLTPQLHVKNAAGDVVMKIKYPIYPFGFSGNVEFKVLSKDERTQVGMICKQWSGLRKIFTDSNDFGITFPMDLDVKMKAVMLGACFLIDFMFFEK